MGKTMFATTTFELKTEKNMDSRIVITCTAILGIPTRNCMALAIITFTPVRLLASARANPPPEIKNQGIALRALGILKTLPSRNNRPQEMLSCTNFQANNASNG